MHATRFQSTRGCALIRFLPLLLTLVWAGSYEAVANTAPTITAIADQSTNEDTALGPISFTVGDAETVAKDLTVTAVSSDTTLVPADNIVLGGSGADRTVTVTPATNQNGTATITITVSDGELTASEPFQLAVNAVNDTPTITAIDDQTIDEDTVLGPVALTVGDVETAAGTLTLTAASTNTTLVPVANIVFGGSDADRTVTVTPATNQTGTTKITITVSDGVLTASEEFQLTVKAVNDPPTITPIADQSIEEDTTTGALSFTIGDVDTALDTLTVRASSSDLQLVPIENIVLGGSGASRTVTVTPVTNSSGTATITITVSDGSADTPEPFLLTVIPVNDPPTITAIADQTTNEDTATSAISFTIGDTETSAGGLTLTATSTNTVLVPVGNIVFGGSGSNRTVTVTPAADYNGMTKITVNVSDGTNSTPEVFLLTVVPVNDAPRITGSLLGTQAAALPDSGLGVALFTNIVITDIDHGRPTNENLTVVVTPSVEMVQFGSFRGREPGSFTLTGTPTNVTTALRGILFDPLSNWFQVGTTQSFSINLAVSDVVGVDSPDNGDRQVYVRSVNDPPQFSVAVVPSTISDNQDAQPFSVSISDPDPTDSIFTVSFSVTNDATSSFGTLDPANPTFTGTKPIVELAVRTVRYRPVRDSAISNQTIRFEFRVADEHQASATNTGQLTLTGVNDPPDITGVTQTLLRTSDDPNQAPLLPFQNVRIVDLDQNGQQILRVTLAVDDPAKGTLSQTRITNTAALVTAAIRNVTFQASQRPNRVVGETVTAQLSITVVDSLGAQRSDNNTRVAITSVNGAPEITGVPTDQPLLISPATPFPFQGIAIDDDDGTNVTVTVSLDDPAKGIFTNLGGFVAAGAGVYRIVTNTTAASTALNNLGFQVSSTYLFPPNAPGGTTFAIEARDAVLNATVKTLSIVIQEEPRNLLVTRMEDDLAEGSLRHAVGAAENNDVITFALGEYPALLRFDANLGPIVVSRNLTLLGPGADLLTLSGDSDGNGRPDTQLFRILARVTMDGLALSDGSGTGGLAEGSGGAIYVGASGRLTLRSCSVSNSRALQWGGAIDVVQGSLTLDRCLVRANTTDETLGFGGGAISLYTDEPCRFVNTTFSANRQRSLSGFGGGAIYVENFTPSSELLVNVEHCTFAGNEDVAASGSSIHANVFGTLVAVRNSIFADGRERNLEVQGSARIVSGGGNISDDSTRVVLLQGGQPKAIILLDRSDDLTETEAGLLPLDLGLQPTPAYPLSASSPAKGHAAIPTETVDQRGVIRDAQPDAGAVEFNAFQRLVINEIHFDPNLGAGEADFIELYAPRDSTPVDVSGYSVWVDNTNCHVFPAGTVVQPGHGVVLADSSISAIDAAHNSTPVVDVVNPLDLGLRSLVELRNAEGRSLIQVAYNGQFIDPSDPSNLTKYQRNSITLTPQFRGAAYLPHSVVVVTPPPGGADLERTSSANTTSPGADAAPSPFGAPNAYPLAVDDAVVVSEDTFALLPVLENDFDADGLDWLVVVDVSTTADAGTTNRATAFSVQGASVEIDPGDAPLRGTAVVFDPRAASNLQQLPEGAKTTDAFYYAMVDIGTGPILGYSGGSGITILSPGHRLTNGVEIVISGAGTAAYNGVHTVTGADEDSFSISGTFSDDPAVRGIWVTKEPRQPTDRSKARVNVTVLGANDPPAPLADLVLTDEEQPIRIMADPDLAGSDTAFDTDDLYPAIPDISPVWLLGNDDDVDTDDAAGTLKVVGIVGTVHPITGWQGTPGVSPVTVTAPSHGLAGGATILISGYGGHPSYNGFHTVAVVDTDTFSIPIPFLDDHATKGVWTILDDANRLAATSQFGAAVRLEIRSDRIETSVVYNPRTSAYLNGLGVTNGVSETADDLFYYAVEDRHGALSLAPVTVRVSGVNDQPQPVADPDALSLLAPWVAGSFGSLGEVLSALQVLYYLPPISAEPNRIDAQVQLGDEQDAAVRLTDLWVTDEDNPVTISAADLLQNDEDVDRSDRPALAIRLDSTASFAGALLSTDPDRLHVTYDPRPSTRLNALAREEPLLDYFEVTVTDPSGGAVTGLVAVLVVGANDTPRATDDVAIIPEDQILLLEWPGVLANDEEDDLDGSDPENRLVLLSVTDFLTGAGAHVSTTLRDLTYDPTVSSFLNGLAQGQSHLDFYEYTVLDGSFIFANDDLFRVESDGTGFVLEVLANDRNLSGVGGSLRIVSFGVPDHLGSVTTNAAGTALVYSPEVNFVGDEVFTYTVSDEDGNTDSALVTVRVTVNQLNGNLQANPDHFSVAKGESPVLPVLANDNIIPASGNDLTITRIVSQPASGDQVVLAGNQLTYRQQAAGPYPYEATFSYEVSGGGSARAVALVTVVVTNRQGTLSIRDDAFGIMAGSRDNALDVLANDNLLPGSVSGLTITQVVAPPAHGQVTIGAGGRHLAYTPAAGFIGQDTLSYVVSDGVGGTGTGEVRIAVGALTTANDFFAVPYDDPDTNADDGTYLLNVLANDGVLGSTANSLVIASVTPTVTTLGTMEVDSGGAHLVFDPAVDQAGEQQFQYTVSDGSGRTAVGSVTVVVLREGVRANGDYFTIRAGSGANELPVLANDVSIPDRGRILTIISIGSGPDAPNRGGSVTVNDAGDRLIYTPAPEFTGEETFTYTMTDSRKSDTAKVVVRVSAGELSANPDAFTVFFAASAGQPPQQFTLPVLANDRVLPDAGQVLTITGVGIDDVYAANAPDQLGEVRISTDGSSLIYVPRDEDGPFPYVERFTYIVSDGTARRAETFVTVEVQQRTNARDLETHDDVFTVASDSRNNVLRVLANDNVQPGTAAGWVITTVLPASFGGAVSISGATLLYTPRPGFIGTDEFQYAVVDGLGGTGTATVRVKVGDLPLNDDLFTAISESADNVLDVLANDGIRPVTGENYNLVSAGTPDQGGAVAISNGTVLYTPSAAHTGGYPYVECFSYAVEDDAGGLFTGRVAVTVYARDADRDTATLSITVEGVNDPPTITGTSTQLAITDKDTVLPFAGVTIGEVDDQGAELLTVVITMDPGQGLLRELGAFTDLGGGVYMFHGTAADATIAIRQLLFDPVENRITVPLTEVAQFTISLDDGFVATPVIDATTMVAVMAVNDPPLISGTVANQTVYHRSSLYLFSSVTITEVDDLTLQSLQITVVIDNPTNGHLTSLNGFVDTGGGVYILSAVTAAQATTALRGLVFVPTTGDRLVPGATEITTFTIAVEDGFAPPVVDSQTSVIALHEMVAKILAGDGAPADAYGSAVAASLDVVVIGAPFDDDRGSDSGAAYILTRTPTVPEVWTQVQKLVPVEVAAGDRFGSSVAVCGDFIVVGAPLGVKQSSGSAYVFRRSSPGSGTWNQVKKLEASDGASGDQFGFAVSIHGDVIAVGSPFDDDFGTSSGAVYLYGRNRGGAETWGFVKKLRPTDSASGDQFGFAVEMDNDQLIVGAPYDVATVNSGSAYLFARNLGGSDQWGELRKLVPSDGAGGDEFGSAVALDNGVAAVGAPEQDQVGNDAGAAYVFQRDQGGIGNWGQTTKLLPPLILPVEKFGYAVALEGKQLVVGVPYAGSDNQSRFGRAFLFGRNQGGSDAWGLVQELARSDWYNNDEFGAAVSIGQNTIAIGAPKDDDRGLDSGSVYLYRIKYNNPPRLATPIPDQMAVEGSAFTFTIPLGTFADPDMDEVLTLSAALAGGGPLPVWLSFDAATAGFSGTPTVSETYTIRVTVTDSEGATAFDDFDLVVASDAMLAAMQQAWRAVQFGEETLNSAGAEATIWGDNSDPDADGVSNLQEYLFGTTPRFAAAGDRSPLRATRESPQTLLLSFRRPAQDLRWSYVLEVTTDLRTWVSAGTLVIHESTRSMAGGLQQVTYRLRAPDANKPLFFRIKIDPK